MYDTRPSNDNVGTGDTSFIGVECLGTVNVVFPSETGENLGIKDVAIVLELNFNLFSLIAAHQNQIYFKPSSLSVAKSLMMEVESNRISIAIPVLAPDVCAPPATVKDVDDFTACLEIRISTCSSRQRGHLECSCRES